MEAQTKFMLEMLLKSLFLGILHRGIRALAPGLTPRNEQMRLKGLFKPVSVMASVPCQGLRNKTLPTTKISNGTAIVSIRPATPIAKRRSSFFDISKDLSQPVSNTRLAF